MLENPNIKKDLEDWNIAISDKPIEIAANKIDAGDMIIGNKI